MKQTFNRESFIVRAPTRADLAGGTLDLWPLYCLVGTGQTINVALDLYASCYFHIEEHTVCRVEVRSRNQEVFFFYEPLKEVDWAKVPKELRFPVAILSRYFISKVNLPPISLKIEIDTQAPVGSGLGGSSALCVALVRGLGRVFGDFQEQGWQWKMLDWVRDVEAEYLKTPTGTQDYLASLFGSLSQFSYDIGGVGYQPYDKTVVSELKGHLLILFSGEMHNSGLSNWEIYKRAIDGDAGVMNGLKSIRDLTQTLDRELRSSLRTWQKIGQHISEEWNIRKATFNVHTKRLDEIVDFLKKKKVYGVKVCGAAQGGSLLVIADPTKRKTLITECLEQGIQVLTTTIAPQGVQISNLPTSED